MSLLLLFGQGVCAGEWFGWDYVNSHVGCTPINEQYIFEFALDCFVPVFNSIVTLNVTFSYFQKY